MDVIDVDTIIEEYVKNFRNLLIALFKGKNKINNKKNKHNYCLHINYKGKECKRMVKNKGDACIFHMKKKSKPNENNNLLHKERKINLNLLNNENHNSSNENINRLNGFDDLSNNSLNNKRNTNDILCDKNNNSLNEKDNLLEIINKENNKLTCYKCKGILNTKKEIASNICYYCTNFPCLSRNKTLVKCKNCCNNTLNFNKLCSNCFIDDKKESYKICLNCNSNKIQPNQNICNYCYKKQKRKIIITKSNMMIKS